MITSLSTARLGIWRGHYYKSRLQLSVVECGHRFFEKVKLDSKMAVHVVAVM